MSERTLESFPTLRSPSFEVQQAAIQAGYTSVRDWMLDQCIAEIRLLKKRVEQLEQDVAPLEVIDAEG